MRLIHILVLLWFYFMFVICFKTKTPPSTNTEASSSEVFTFSVLFLTLCISNSLSVMWSSIISLKQTGKHRDTVTHVLRTFTVMMVPTLPLLTSQRPVWTKTISIDPCLWVLPAYFGPYSHFLVSIWFIPNSFWSGVRSNSSCQQGAVYHRLMDTHRFLSLLHHLNSYFKLTWCHWFGSFWGPAPGFAPCVPKMTSVSFDELVCQSGWSLRLIGTSFRWSCNLFSPDFSSVSNSFFSSWRLYKRVNDEFCLCPEETSFTTVAFRHKLVCHFWYCCHFVFNKRST